MRLDHVLCVLFVLALIIILTPGCGTLYPRTTITGGEAGGTINRDRAVEVTYEPVTPAPQTGGFWKGIDAWMQDMMKEATR